MYAVIRTGGKQYRVEKGQTLAVEQLTGQVGDEHGFDDVLLLGEADQLTVGQPNVAGASVRAKIVRHARDKKVKIIKFKRRKHHMKQMGHRQGYTVVEVTDIVQS